MASKTPEQPIFYPVTNQQYAIDINEWNLSQFGIGYVTRFEVKKDFVDKYEIQKVGGKIILNSGYLRKNSKN